MRVIDASALGKYLNRENGWEKVEKFLMEGCITIDLAFKEIANMLWKRVKLKDLKEEQVIGLIEAFLNSGILRVYPQNTLLKEALELSARLDMTVYDSLYVILAKKLNVDLITSDKLQAEKAITVGIRTLLV
ncbi:MAG: type II toxin-antitoxin system VapC family toxin [Thermoproteota archaeon]|nr:type II toxin-antitoxin system VapC family toxin [Candidatus Brockarchaeota archaeon]